MARHGERGAGRPVMSLKAESADVPRGDVRPARVWLRAVLLFAILVALAIGFALGFNEHLSLRALAERRDELQAFVSRNLPFAAAAYAGVYVVAISLSFPGASALTIAGGLMFG